MSSVKTQRQLRNPDTVSLLLLFSFILMCMYAAWSWRSTWSRQENAMPPVNKVVNEFETNNGRRLRQKQTMKQKHKCNLFITKRVLLFTQQHCKICNVGIQRWNLTPHTRSKFRAHDLLFPKQLRWPLCQGKCFNFYLLLLLPPIASGIVNIHSRWECLSTKWAFRAWATGLPDFSCYNFPKRVKYTKLP
jgi:hypothetical protein